MGLSLLKEGRTLHDVHMSVPEALADDARRAAQLPARSSVQSVIRVALARLAGWPDGAVQTVARIRAEGGE